MKDGNSLSRRLETGESGYIYLHIKRSRLKRNETRKGKTRMYAQKAKEQVLSQCHTTWLPSHLTSHIRCIRRMTQITGASKWI